MRAAARTVFLSVAALAGCRTVEPAPAPAPVRAAAQAPQIADTPVSPDCAIDLGTALRLAGVGNPTVNLARERVQEAAAEHLSAKALRLPSVNLGMNYYLHGGALQTSAGQIREIDRQGLYLGAGARAVGAGSAAVPGVWLFAHLGDAVYEPLAAKQRLSATRSDAQAVQNAILRDVATAYLQLLGAEARLEIVCRGEVDVAEVVRLTRVYAEKGQGRQADADRAQANAELLRRQVREVEESAAVASARLCRLLNLDPSCRLKPPAGTIHPLRLLDEESELAPLVAQAVHSRPEVFARSADLAEARTRVSQERLRPLLPLVSVGYSGGAFGGGSNVATSDFSKFDARSDFDVAAVWTFENLGFGNRARVMRANAGVGQSLAGYDFAVNQIRREVAQALAEAKAAARQVETATGALTVAEEGYKLEVERIRQGEGRPIETLDSFRQLLDARQEQLRAVVAFNVAQFRLFVAVGFDPQSTADCPPVIVPAVQVGP